MSNKPEIINVEEHRCKILCKNLTTSMYRQSNFEKYCYSTIFSVMIRTPDNAIAVFKFKSPDADDEDHLGDIEQTGMKWLNAADVVPVETISGSDSYVTVRKVTLRKIISHTFKKDDVFTYNRYVPLKISLAQDE